MEFSSPLHSRDEISLLTHLSVGSIDGAADSSPDNWLLQFE